MEILRRACGEEDPDYARGLNNLGSMYLQVGDYVHAEPLLRRAMEIRKRALGENDLDYVRSLQDLAMLYHRLGDYARRRGTVPPRY